MSNVKAPSLPFNRPYKKFTSPALTGSRVVTLRGWLETSVRMGIRRPVLHLSRKRVTLTDTKPDQNRLQLTTKDVYIHGSAQFIALADKAYRLKDKDNGGLDVKIMDRHGNKYHNVKFKYISSSQTFRFIGPGYGEFLVNSDLKENQLLDIWGLLKKDEEDDGEIWLAFVNYSADDIIHAND